MDKHQKVGPRGSPVLRSKQSVVLDQSADVQRIMGMSVDDESPITDPAARSYAARIQERAIKKSSSLKGKSRPLGHVESPSSEKMQAIANQATGVVPRPQFMEPPPDMIEQARQPERSAPSLHGVGSAYHVNQSLSQGQLGREPMSLREANDVAAKPDFQGEEQKKSVAEDTHRDLDDAEKELEPNLPDLDFDTLAEVRDGLMSKARQEEIESRLEPLNIVDMIVKRELQQEIVIIPDKFSVRIRTFSQRENLWVLKYLYDFPGSAAYVNELLNTCRLVLGLVAINGQLLPDHREDVGKTTEKVDKTAFEKKMFHVASFPVQLVADMSVQSIWFQERVDKLFSVEAIKNG